LGLELLDWGHAAEMLEAVATLMGGVLGWSEKKTAEEVAQYRQLLDRIRRRQQGYQGHD
jgi:glycerol-3-phosphate dehydrogenase